MKRIIVLLALGAALAAQEAEPTVLRVYDLGALAVAPRRMDFGEDAPPLIEREFSLLGSSHQDIGAYEEYLEQEDWAPAELICELVKAFIGDVEATWELRPIAAGRQLVARLAEADHKTVARVLEQIRAAGDPPVEIDVRHLVIPDRELDDAGRAALLGSGRLEAEQLAALARLDVRGGRRGGTLQMPLGRWGTYRDIRELRYVPDFDVEIAQGASVPDPVPSILADGLKAAVRPFLLRDGRILLRVVASMGDRGEPRRFGMAATEVQDELRLRNTDYGELEQCDFRGGAVSTELVLAPGKPGVVVLASEAGHDMRWDVLALTVRTAPRAVAGDTFAITPVGALVSDDNTRRIAQHSVTGEIALRPGNDGPEGRISADEILELMRADFPADQRGEFLMHEGSLNGGSILMRGSAANLRAANERIAAFERELIRPALVEIQLTVEGAGKDERTVGLLAAPVTLGRPAALAAYLRMDTVGDYDVEVAQESRISDPNHVVVTAGVFANVEVFRNLDGSYRLEGDLTVSAAPEGIRTSTARAGGMPLLQSVPVSKRVVPIRADFAPGSERTVDLGSDPYSEVGTGRLLATLTVHPQ